MPIQIVQEICDCAGFSHVTVFHKSGGTPLDSSAFNIMTILLGMWVPHAAGVLQTGADEGEVGLTFNTFWARIKITTDETKDRLAFLLLFSIRKLQFKLEDRSTPKYGW